MDKRIQEIEKFRATLRPLFERLVALAELCNEPGADYGATQQIRDGAALMAACCSIHNLFPDLAEFQSTDIEARYNEIQELLAAAHRHVTDRLGDRRDWAYQNGEALVLDAFKVLLFKAVKAPPQQALVTEQRVEAA